VSAVADDADVALHVRPQHGEGPLWDDETARLWWVDIAGERVHCFDPQSSYDCSWSTGCQPGGVVLSAAGDPLIALPDGLALLDRATGTFDLRVPIEADRPESRSNDIKVDGRGRIWVGTMPYDKRTGHAGLYRVDAFGVECVVDGLSIANGPAFDEARDRLYLADTAISIVYVYDVELESGRLGARRLFVDLSDAQVWPDGMAVDDEGMLWVALGRAGAVHRYRPDGSLDGIVELPTANPTSVAFGGTDHGDLYITTSWFDLEADGRAAQPLAGAIFRLRPGVTGHAASRCAELPQLRAGSFDAEHELLRL
jgi:sugar lactone lactonase YvrE